MYHVTCPLSYFYNILFFSSYSYSTSRGIYFEGTDRSIRVGMIDITLCVTQGYVCLSILKILRFALPPFLEMDVNYGTNHRVFYVVYEYTNVPVSCKSSMFAYLDERRSTSYRSRTSITPVTLQLRYYCCCCCSRLCTRRYRRLKMLNPGLSIHP